MIKNSWLIPFKKKIRMLLTAPSVGAEQQKTKSTNVNVRARQPLRSNKKDNQPLSPVQFVAGCCEINKEEQKNFQLKMLKN